MRLLPAIVAAVAPVLLVAGVLGALSVARPGEGGLAASELDARIADGADVVLLGNSKVGTDLDEKAVAAATGDPGARVVKMNVNGTGAPVWYAILKNRVYGRGAQPKVVVVYATLRSMVQVDVPAGAERAMLDKELGTRDPVIDRKVFGVEHANEEWERVLAHRTALRHGITDTIRDAVVGALFAPPEGGALLARGRAVSEPALGKVLGTDALTDTRRASALPIVEIEKPARADTKLDAEDTLLPDLVALAKENGAEIVFLRAPLASHRREYDAVEPELERKVVEALGAAGAAYVDLRPLGPADVAYRDGVHMTKSGRTRFVPAAIAELKRVGLGGDGPFEPARWVEPRPRPAVTRVGDGPVLPPFEPVRGRLPCDWQALAPTIADLSDTALKERGFGEVSPFVVLEGGTPLPSHAAPEEITGPCAGKASHWRNVVKFTPTSEGVTGPFALGLDPAVPTVGRQYEEAWWVYPGTSVRFDFPAGAVAGDRNVLLRAVDVVAGAGSPTIAVGGGAPVGLERVGVGLEALVHAAATGEAWSVDVASPADGPWLLVRGLAVGSDDDPWHVVGGPREDAVVDLLAGELTWGEAPHRLFGPIPKPQEAAWRPGSWFFEVEDWGVPFTEEVHERAGAGCSPLRLKIDDVPAETIVDEARKLPLATAVHSKERLIVRSADDARPIDGSRTFSLYLDPQRRCVGATRWLYPKDALAVTLKDGSLGPLRRAADSLQISGASFYGADGDAVDVEVRAGGEVVAVATLPLAGFDKGIVTVPLAKPVPRDATGVSVSLRSRSEAGYLLITAATLTEVPPALFASL
ncbi:MAG: hypothetical protein ACOZNI_03740 [Myxococcota bacterium]